jgi:hypothetical protein
MSFKNKELVVLLDHIQRENLLKKLVQQINKDASLSGIDFYLNENSTVQNIVYYLNDLITDLIKSDYNGYVNFLYRIDISELDIVKIKELDFNDLSENVTILILKKEWQKVWFKNRIR